LILATTLHVSMILIFALVFRWGVAAVAWSAVISRTVCAVLVIVLLCRSDHSIKLEFRLLRIHRDILKRILRIGLPGGFQSVIISGSNTLLQSYFNRLGTVVVAGSVAASRVDALATLPVNSMALATSTFVGQNLGAGEVKRARVSVRTSMVMGLSSTVVLSASILLFAPGLLRIFTSDEQVLAAAMQFMWIYAPFYFLFCFTQILSGALRGAGDVRIPTLVFIGSFVVMRQTYLFFMTQAIHTIQSVAAGFPGAWFVASVMIVIYYRRSDWSAYEKKTVPQDDEP